jgi:hypothetical protein
MICKRIKSHINNNKSKSIVRMDKVINKRIKSFVTDFKSHIKKITLSTFPDEDETKINAFLQEIYNYECLTLTKEDISKRKRIKNAIPGCNRCIAKRANGEQCTRKQKEGYEYCGTHVKGIPHGIISNKEDALNGVELVRAEVVAKDIHGIVYYVDQYNNVYKTEDILNEKKNPEVIAKCEVINGEYAIRKFGLV